MLNIKLKCQREEFYPFVLNTCRNILQLDILIAPAGISTRSTAAVIIIVMSFGSEGTHPVWFKDTYCAAATRPAGRYNGT